MRAICASGLAQVKTDRLAPSVAVESATDAQILAAQKRADELIAQMTLDEKLQMVHGTGLPATGKRKVTAHGAVKSAAMEGQWLKRSLNRCRT
jgi:hypothetical protein